MMMLYKTVAQKSFRLFSKQTLMITSLLGLEFDFRFMKIQKKVLLNRLLSSFILEEGSQ